MLNQCTAGRCFLPVFMLSTKRQWWFQDACNKWIYFLDGLAALASGF